MYTLVVVDMQAKFPASLDTRVQNNCKRAIRNAIKNKAAIIFLEYVDYGPTLPCLTDLVKGYSNVHHATKSDWDGSPHSNVLIKKHGLPNNKFKVCGVYTECCVAATVIGLSRTYNDSKINLLSKACGSTCDAHHQRGIRDMKPLRNVRIWA